MSVKQVSDIEHYLLIIFFVNRLAALAVVTAEIEKHGNLYCLFIIIVFFDTYTVTFRFISRRINFNIEF